MTVEVWPWLLLRTRVAGQENEDQTIPVTGSTALHSDTPCNQPQIIMNDAFIRKKLNQQPEPMPSKPTEEQVFIPESLAALKKNLPSSNQECERPLNWTETFQVGFGTKSIKQCLKENPTPIEPPTDWGKVFKEYKDTKTQDPTVMESMLIEQKKQTRLISRICGAIGFIILLKLLFF